MSEARIIKRYANRKLYDTQHSKYVTLEQISEMIREGDDVKIIDNKTKEDLTSVTLAQIIFEEEKKQRSFLSLQTMRGLIQNGGESFANLVTEAQRRVTSILPRRKDERDESEQGQAEPAQAEPGAAEPGHADTGDSARTDAAHDDTGAPVTEAQPLQEIGKRGREGLSSLREFREWLQQSQRTIDEWQKRADHRIRDMVGGISPFSGLQKDVKGLATRIAELEARLAQLASDEAKAHSATATTTTASGTATAAAAASEATTNTAAAADAATTAATDVDATAVADTAAAADTVAAADTAAGAATDTAADTTVDNTSLASE